MDNTEVKILLIEDDLNEAEKAIDILRNNNLADKLIHLKNEKEASDFIFCKGVFSKRNIENQPKTILFNVKGRQPNDVKFLKRISSDDRTKDIPLVVFYSKAETESSNNSKYSMGDLRYS